MKIDRVYYNGVIRTMVSEGDTVEALAVHNGTIVAAGTSKEMGRVPNRGVSGPSPENRRHPCEVNLSLRPPSGQWRSL